MDFRVRGFDFPYKITDVWSEERFTACQSHSPRPSVIAPPDQAEDFLEREESLFGFFAFFENRPAVLAAEIAGVRYGKAEIEFFPVQFLRARADPSDFRGHGVIFE